MNMRNREDKSVIALLYDEYRRTYPETAESIQREIETLYQRLHLHHLANPEEIAAVFIGMIDDRERYAYEAGVQCGVRLLGYPPYESTSELLARLNDQLLRKLMLTDGLVVLAKQKQGGVRGIKITPYQHREMYQASMDLDVGQ